MRLPQRKIIRMKNYDYRAPGYYFITFITKGRWRLFGTIKNEQMYLNAAGYFIHRTFSTLKDRYPGVEVDTFVVMPEHVHAIIVLKRENKKYSLSDIIKNIKTFTTCQYIKGVGEKKFRPFYKRLWHRSYHDIIIRNAISLQNIRRYILNNPKQYAKPSRRAQLLRRLSG